MQSIFPPVGQFSLVLVLIFLTMASSTPCKPLIDRIHNNAARDSIDLTILPFHQEALESIAALSTQTSNITMPDFSYASRIDTHTHPIPDWFRALEPQAAGRETPSWNVRAHLQFMSEHQIARSVLCISTPQANAFLAETDEKVRKKKTVALARLLNEFSAEVCRLYPQRFSWLAITTLPYVEEAVVEVKYALEESGAIGVGVLTNHEGMYPGDEAFDGLWKYLQTRAEDYVDDGREVVFVHPTEPTIQLEDGRFVNSRPCKSIKHFTFHIVPSPDFIPRCSNAFQQHHSAPALENSTSRLHAQYQA